MSHLLLNWLHRISLMRWKGGKAGYCMGNRGSTEGPSTWAQLWQLPFGSDSPALAKTQQQTVVGTGPKWKRSAQLLGISLE